MSSTDRIEKEILLRAPKARVWRALTDAEQFGTWFRARLASPFVVGKHVTGNVTYPGYEHVEFEAFVETMDAEQYFAFRWHPAAVDPTVDVSQEPTTLVEFRLEEVPDGTLLRVVESGFDRLPPERRDDAFRMNTEGWTGQLENVRQHVSG